MTRFNERFVAWCGGGVPPILPRGWQADFMAFIERAKVYAEANQMGVERVSWGLRIVDHEAFTLACWGLKTEEMP